MLLCYKVKALIDLEKLNERKSAVIFNVDSSTLTLSVLLLLALVSLYQRTSFS